MMRLIYQIRELFSLKLARDTSIIFLGNVLSSALAIIFTILAARFLGPENWSTVAVVISVIAILSTIGDFGLTSSLFRFVSGGWENKQKAKKIFGTIFSLRLLTALFLGLVLVVLSGVFSSLLFKSDNYLLTIFVAIGLVGSLLIDFQVTVVETRQNWKLAAILLAFANLLRVVFIVMLVLTNNLSVINVLLIFVGSSVIAFFLSLFWQRIPTGVSFDWRDIKNVLPFSSWMGVNRIFSSLNSRLPVILLLQLSTPAQTGIFAAAKQLSDGIPIILGSLATVFAPRFVMYQRKELKSFFKKTLFLSIIISLGILLGIFLAKPIISLFGAKYQNSVVVLQWLLISLIPFALSTSTVNILIYAFNKPQIISLLSTFQLPFIFFGNIFLIPHIGVLAPVLLFGISNILTLLVTSFFVWYYFRK